MEVTWQTALEIFGLKEGFTKDELNKSFRRLSKVSHPDTGGDENLFRFIMSCKETLSKTNNSTTQTEKQQTQPQREETKKPEKEKVYVELTTLYDIFYNLSKYTTEYDITDIRGVARVHITPCKNKKERRSINIEVQQYFKEFERLGFVNFATTLVLPETLKKFKKFNIQVEFMGKTFKFKLSMKNPFYIVKYAPFIGFNSIIELKFE